MPETPTLLAEIGQIGSDLKRKISTLYDDQELYRLFTSKLFSELKAKQLMFKIVCWKRAQINNIDYRIMLVKCGGLKAASEIIVHSKNNIESHKHKYEVPSISPGNTFYLDSLREVLTSLDKSARFYKRSVIKESNEGSFIKDVTFSSPKKKSLNELNCVKEFASETSEKLNTTDKSFDFCEYLKELLWNSFESALSKNSIKDTFSTRENIMNSSMISMKTFLSDTDVQMKDLVVTLKDIDPKSVFLSTPFFSDGEISRNLIDPRTLHPAYNSSCQLQKQILEKVRTRNNGKIDDPYLKDSVEVAELPDNSLLSLPPCGEYHCSLGCVCSSVKRGFQKPESCGLIECVFGCSCKSVFIRTSTEFPHIAFVAKRPKRNVRPPSKIRDFAVITTQKNLVGPAYSQWNKAKPKNLKMSLLSNRNDTIPEDSLMSLGSKLQNTRLIVQKNEENRSQNKRKKPFNKELGKFNNLTKSKMLSPELEAWLVRRQEMKKEGASSSNNLKRVVEENEVKTSTTDKTRLQGGREVQTRSSSLRKLSVSNVDALHVSTKSKFGNIKAKSQKQVSEKRKVKTKSNGNSSSAEQKTMIDNKSDLSKVFLPSTKNLYTPNKRLASKKRALNILKLKGETAIQKPKESDTNRKVHKQSKRIANRKASNRKRIDKMENIESNLPKEEQTIDLIIDGSEDEEMFAFFEDVQRRVSSEMTENQSVKAFTTRKGSLSQESFVNGFDESNGSFSRVIDNMSTKKSNCNQDNKKLPAVTMNNETTPAMHVLDSYSPSKNYTEEKIFSSLKDEQSLVELLESCSSINERFLGRELPQTSVTSNEILIEKDDETMEVDIISEDPNPRSLLDNCGTLEKEMIDSFELKYPFMARNYSSSESVLVCARVDSTTFLLSCARCRPVSKEYSIKNRHKAQDLSIISEDSQIEMSTSLDSGTHKISVLSQNLLGKQMGSEVDEDELEDKTLHCEIVSNEIVYLNSNKVKIISNCDWTPRRLKIYETILGNLNSTSPHKCRIGIYSVEIVDVSQLSPKSPSVVLSDVASELDLKKYVIIKDSSKKQVQDASAYHPVATVQLDQKDIQSTAIETLNDNNSLSSSNANQTTMAKFECQENVANLQTKDCTAQSNCSLDMSKCSESVVHPNVIISNLKRKHCGEVKRPRKFVVLSKKYTDSTTKTLLSNQTRKPELKPRGFTNKMSNKYEDLTERRDVNNIESSEVPYWYIDHGCYTSGAQTQTVLIPGASNTEEVDKTSETVKGPVENEPSLPSKANDDSRTPPAKNIPTRSRTSEMAKAIAQKWHHEKFSFLQTVEMFRANKDRYTSLASRLSSNSHHTASLPNQNQKDTNDLTTVAGPRN